MQNQMKAFSKEIFKKPLDKCGYICYYKCGYRKEVK